MHKIAIIIESYDSQSYDDERQIVSSITDWSEVDDETLKILNASSWKNGFRIIERPIDESTFIKKTVADYVRLAQEQEEKLEKEREKRRAADEAKKLKRLAKTESDKRRLLQKLKEELGEE